MEDTLQFTRAARGASGKMMLRSRQRERAVSMTPVDLPAGDVEALLRAVRALGAHRYVAGRTHAVHAFAIAAAHVAAGPPELSDAAAWAEGVLADETVDVASRDERLVRACTDAELVAVLGAFLRTTSAPYAEDELLDWLERAELPLPETEAFDPATEEDIHPLLVDAGWELLPLATLDPERHKGAIQWFGEPIQFDAARFEEESAIPKPVYLQELPALGPLELVRWVDDAGGLTEDLTVWIEGNATYHEYVLAGVKRAAKL
jgi:hypothetical protein